MFLTLLRCNTSRPRWSEQCGSGVYSKKRSTCSTSLPLTNFLCPRSWFTLSYVSFTFSTCSLYHLISSVSHAHTHTHIILFTFSTYSNYGLSLSLITTHLYLSTCFLLTLSYTLQHRYILSSHFSSRPISASVLLFFLRVFLKRPLTHWWLHVFWPFFCFSKRSMFTASTTPTPLPGRWATLTGRPRPQRLVVSQKRFIC